MTSTYNPEIKIFYGPLDPNHRLVPAPNISISLEYKYSNDTIIGYSYIVTLNGLATSLDLRDLNYGGTVPASPLYNGGAAIDHMNKVREILVQNGNILHIVNGVNDSNTHILKAKGGILRSLSFEESANNLIHNTPYTASLEFNSIDFTDKEEGCSSPFLDASTFNADGIVDVAKYKIKSFEDSWSFTFDENESFNRVQTTDITNLNINNHSFNIEYSINAVGKHFFDYDNETTGTSKLLPAWEQAKNFVQYRLYDQVTSLINTILKDSYSSSCNSPDGQDDILEPGSANGLISGLNNANYEIYNELITCECSESDGSFSAKYSAIVKTKLGNEIWSSMNTKHTVSKSTVTNNSNGISIYNISINGTIEGLIEGGLIRINEPIILPQSGSFLIFNNPSKSKYNNAKLLLDQIYSDNDYYGGIGECGKRDLKLNYKNALGITLDQLGTAANTNDCVPSPPHPVSFNLTHDYKAGTINYVVEYSSKNNCGRKFNDISISTSNPNKVFAIFNIPNSYNCAKIQELGTYSAKKVNLVIKGVDLSENGQPTNLDATAEAIKSLSLGCYDLSYLPVGLLPLAGTFIITQKQYTRNPLDGSFTLTLSYICGTTGCPL